MKRIFIIILILSISLFSLSLSIQLHSYSISSYTNNYEKNNLGEITGKSKDEYKAISQDIIDYLKGGSIELMERNFNQKEVLHMKDVQKLYNINNMIKWISLIISIILFIIIYKKRKRTYLNLTYKGLFINYLFLILLGVLVKLDFSKYFIYFHLIFFDNDLWILNINEDLLLQMMPENFFFTMAIKIGITYILIILITQIVLFLIDNYLVRE